MLAARELPYGLDWRHTRSLIEDTVAACLFVSLFGWRVDALCSRLHVSLMEQSIRK